MKGKAEAKGVREDTSPSTGWTKKKVGEEEEEEEDDVSGTSFLKGMRVVAR